MRLQTWHLLATAGVLFTAPGRRALIELVPSLESSLEGLPTIGEVADGSVGGIAGMVDAGQASEPPPLGEGAAEAKALAADLAKLVGNAYPAPYPAPAPAPDPDPAPAPAPDPAPAPAPAPGRPDLSRPQAWDGSSLAGQSRSTQDLFIAQWQQNAARQWAAEHNRYLQSKGWRGPNQPPAPRPTSSPTSSPPAPQPTSSPPAPQPTSSPPAPQPTSSTTACDGQKLSGQSAATQKLFNDVHGSNAARRWAQEHNKAIGC